MGRNACLPSRTLAAAKIAEGSVLPRQARTPKKERRLAVGFFVAFEMASRHRASSRPASRYVIQKSERHPSHTTNELAEFMSGQHGRCCTNQERMPWPRRPKHFLDSRPEHGIIVLKEQVYGVMLYLERSIGKGTHVKPGCHVRLAGFWGTCSVQTSTGYAHHPERDWDRRCLLIPIGPFWLWRLSRQPPSSRLFFLSALRDVVAAFVAAPGSPEAP